MKERVRIRPRTIALIAAASLAVAVPPAAIGGGETPVAHVSGTVYIGKNPPYFHGRVGAENETCAGPRPVKVFERLENGERDRIGITESDLSAPRAKWLLPVEPEPGSIFVCLRAKSRTIEIN
jgi:hypothetical protein